MASVGQPTLRALTPTTDVRQAYAELAGNYAPYERQLQNEESAAQTTRNASIGKLGEEKGLTLTSLDQAKVNAFTGFKNTANARGMLFSGYQPYQQKSYTDTTYTPGVNKANLTYKEGVQSAQDTYNTTHQSLQDKIAELNLQRMNSAQQLVADTNATNAANARALAAAGPNESQQRQLFSNASLSYLARKAGGNGKISPNTYAAEAIKWLNAGYSLDQFKSVVNSAGLLDKSNGYYNYALQQAVNRSR